MLLKKMRHSAKLNSYEACKQLGISRSMLYKLEEGKRKPSISLVSRIVNTYKCSADEIFNALNYADNDIVFENISEGE